MWFDKIVNLQTLPTELEKLFIDHGWKRDLFFRIRRETSKFIDVRLFESTGSDLERRRFGFAVAYDTADSDFADSRYVATESRLGGFWSGRWGKNKLHYSYFSNHCEFFIHLYK